MVYRFSLGDKVKDLVSGFTGIAFARYEYLNGCIRYEVAPDKLGKTGDVMDGRVFDESQLTLVKALAVKVPPKDTGGPVSNRPVR